MTNIFGKKFPPLKENSLVFRNLGEPAQPGSMEKTIIIGFWDNVWDLKSHLNISMH